MKVIIAGIERNVQNYVLALQGVGLEPVISVDISSTEDYDGLLLPGGGDVDPALYGQTDQGSMAIDRMMDERQLHLTDLFVQARKPILGICKGHQIIDIYFGGTLIQDLAVAPAHQFRGADSVHPCVSMEGTLLRQWYGERYSVNSAHHQGVSRIGDGLKVTAYAEDGTVESLVHESLPILGVQWHPERMSFTKARPDTVDGAPLFWYFKSLMEAGQA